jgi:chromosome partitioning protein
MAGLIVAIALLKGGASKTTVAVGLAEAAAYAGAGAVTIIDADPQGSASHWAQLAADSGRPLRAAVVKMPDPKTEMRRRVNQIARDSAVVIIDSPPPGDLHNAEAVIEAAHRIVMPVPPQLADLARVPPTASIAAKYGKPARAALTQVRGGIGERAAALELLRGWGISLYQAELPLTVAVQRAYGYGLTAGPLLRFGVDLMTEIIKEETDSASDT